jgi:hypothetical protein
MADSQYHAPAALPAGNRRLVGLRGLSGLTPKIASPRGLELHTAQPVASHFIDNTIPATNYCWM